MVRPVSQLVLDLGPPPAPRLDRFVVGANREALEAVQRLTHPQRHSGSRLVYLWGPGGSGRSHLLSGLAQALPAQTVRSLGPASPLADFIHEPGVLTWLIDDVDQLDAERQAAAFHLFDCVAAQAEAALASAGAAPPSQLALMPELATRLGWGLVLQLRPLGEPETVQALQQAFAERGLVVSSEVIPWLMTHTARDLGSLRRWVDALDRHALEQKRPVTLPLLREVLQRLGPSGPAEGHAVESAAR